jgi:hypothetical protein
MHVPMRLPLFAASLTLFLILAACTAATRDDGDTSIEPDTAAEEATPAESTQQETPTPESTPTPIEVANDDAEDEPRREPYWMSQWDTDFDNRIVDLEEIMSGGVPRDGIPPIDDPQFVGFDAADEWLADNEPVISIEIDGDARAYPLQVLTWHEIVNDEFGDLPVAVTFCPLCNAAVSFERTIDGFGETRFGVSGLLRFSDLIMWDNHTESFWQQITGEAIVGELAGERLTMLPSVIVSYEEFKQTYPDGIVLSQETGFTRPYGNNPYVGYDNIDQSPFLFRGERDDRLRPMERVVTLLINDDARAYPYKHLEDHPVVHDELGGEPLVIFWKPGTTSALDQTSIAESRDVGAANVFSPIVDGEELTFVLDDDEIRDEQTGSTWNLLGLATSGELEGTRLTEHVNGTHFWFAWAAFKPDTTVWEP